MTVVAKRFSNTAMVTKLLTAESMSGQAPYTPGGPYVVCSVGPFDLLAGDTVLIDATVELTRPMPGDPEGAWRWYFDSGTAWEGQFAEDHNPAALSYSVIRAVGDPDDVVNGSNVTASEYNVARPMGANILQYEHHKVLPRPCQDHITSTRPNRFYNFVVQAAHAKPGAPVGTFVKVDYAQMQVAVIR